MSTITMTRTVSGLAPADDAAHTIMRKLTLGEVVQVEVQRPRSHKNLRRWWALMNLIYQNCEQFKSPEQAHDYVKILSGHCSQIVSKRTGEIYLIADSIAFGRMDETAFQDVWLRAVKAVAEHILPEITVPELEFEVLKLIGAAA